MAFSISYREAPSNSNPVTGVVSFIVDFFTVLFAPAVSRWGMIIAAIQLYFIVRLIFGLVDLFVEGSFGWSRLIS